MAILPEISGVPLYLFIAISILITVFIIWVLFFRPYNLIKDYSEFGYDKKTGRNSRKKSLVNLALKRRKIGNIPSPYPNSWYAVLESEEIKSGDVKEIYVLGRNLVAWRGKLNETVYVADAYCPHLGAHLGVGGKVNGDCIQCPFHKWSFSGCHGNIKDIPYKIEKDQNYDKLTGLNMWAVLETNGYVYIWYHAEGKEPLWYPENIEEINTGKWRYHGRSEFQVTCHIQEIPENGADIAHLSALHDKPALFEKHWLENVTNLLAKLVQHKWKANWEVNQDFGKGHESIVRIDHHLSFWKELFTFCYVNVLVKQVGAGIVTMSLKTPAGKGILIQSVTPIESMLQKITHRFYAEPGFLHPLALLVLHGEAVQISRDIAIWNRKCYMHRPLLVREDSQIKAFRRWFLQFYSSDGYANDMNCSVTNDIVSS